MKAKRKHFQKEPAEIDEADESDGAATETFSNDLNAEIWSVVSFEKCEDQHLTYEKAEQKIRELIALKTSGLCIITDEAAERINDQNHSKF
ncbi:MAG: hypothetical protein M3T96_00055 [Acidobacteriota bacterium]|nr:hypothetical protein [Acidobacteriota bacterium]